MIKYASKGVSTHVIVCIVLVFNIFSFLNI